MTYASRSVPAAGGTGRTSGARVALTQSRFLSLLPPGVEAMAIDGKGRSQANGEG
jgi:hypothetical protein